MFQHSEADIRKVKRVQFGILGPDEVKAMSVCHIESDRTFEAGKPVANGLMDPRLGSIDRFIKCTSCGMDHAECPGHFGHIELAKPMYHVSFIENVMKASRPARTPAPPLHYTSAAGRRAAPPPPARTRVCSRGATPRAGVRAVRLFTRATRQPLRPHARRRSGVCASRAR